MSRTRFGVDYWIQSFVLACCFVIILRQVSRKHGVLLDAQGNQIKSAGIVSAAMDDSSRVTVRQPSVSPRTLS